MEDLHAALAEGGVEGGVADRNPDRSQGGVARSVGWLWCRLCGFGGGARSGWDIRRVSGFACCLGDSSARAIELEDDGVMY
jgi:hypothetical protein